MSFLDWVADWCEENIPGIGWAIAWVVERIQDGVESAYGWVASWTRWFIDSFKPWVESWIDWLYKAYDSLSSEIYDRLKPLVNAIDSAVDTLESWYNSVKDEINKFVSDPVGYIESHLPSWVSERISNAISKAEDALNWITTKGAELVEWIQNAPSWFLEQLENAKQTILSWIDPIVKPLSDWIDWFKCEFAEFLRDPIGYIQDAAKPLVDALSEKFDKFSKWVNEQFGNVRSAVLGIDDFLKAKLFEFINDFMAWFLWWVLNELWTNEWYAERKEPVEEPKNPVVKYFLTEVTIEKPVYPYESVKKEVEAA